MRIIVDIGHPAHVHFFKNFIWELEKRNHVVLITASKKDVALDLLKTYNFDYTFTCKRYGGVGLAYELIRRDLQMFNLTMKFKPDVITGIHNTIAAHVSKVSRAKSIIFTDNDLHTLANNVTFPFADVICTPIYYKIDLGKKHVRYKAYKELAYLHPNYFKPNPAVLDELGLTVNDRFVILRFVSWQSAHDVSQYGFATKEKIELVHKLEEHAQVFITSEAPLPEDLKKYQISVSPEKLHDLLYYAAMFVGDAGTTSAEAGILGTPAIRYNSFVGPNDLGFLAALEHEHGLICSFSEYDMAFAKALEILKNKNSKQEWAKKRARLIENSIDVTQFMVEFIENYPESFKIMKESPEYQNKFK